MPCVCVVCLHVRVCVCACEYECLFVNVYESKIQLFFHIVWVPIEPIIPVWGWI